MATPHVSSPPTRRVRWFFAVPRQVLLALLMTAAISVVVFAVSEIAAGRVDRKRAEANTLRELATHVGVLRESLIQAESSQRGYLLTGQQRYLQPFKDAAARAEKAAVDLNAMTRGNPALRERSAAIVELCNRKLDEIRVTLTSAEQGRPDAALELLRSGIGIQTMEELTSRSTAFEEEQLASLKERERDIADSMSQQRTGVGVVVLLDLLFLALLANMMIRQFMQRESHREELQSVADDLERTVVERTSQLEALSTHLQTSSEREKAQLARDLHDELGGILTSAKIDIAWVEGHSKAADPDLVARLQRLSSVLDEAVDMKRRVVENLRPSLLDHLGLGAALSWYVNETCSKAGLKFRLDTLRDGAPVPPEMAIAIYRLVQEGLTNTLRYAKATQVKIAVDEEAEGFRVSLADDGIGIHDFKPEALSHGLAGMRHRARALGGSFQLTTAPGEGTRIEAFFPLPAASSPSIQ